MSAISTNQKSQHELASDLQLQLFEQAAAARLLRTILEDVSNDHSDLKTPEVLAGLAAVAEGIARTCAQAAENMSAFTSGARR